MKVQDLIDRLSKFNPQQEILFGCNIESGRSTSACFYQGEVDIGIECVEEVVETLESLEESCDPDQIDALREYTGFVVINVNGVENSCE